MKRLFINDNRINRIQMSCCGHLIGEEEYLHVKTEFNKIIQDKMEEKIEEMNGKHEQEMYEKDKKHNLELLEQEKKHNDEIKSKVSKQVQIQIDKYQHEQNKKLIKEKEDMEQVFALKLKEKNEEIENVKLQRDTAMDDKIAEVRQDEQEKS